MYFTGLMFLTTVSQNVIFITASLLENRRKQTILQEIQKVFNIYKGKGHEVNNVEFFDTEDTPIHTLLADNEFQSLKGEIENDGVQVHVVTKNEHVPEVECQNRVIKERARVIIQTLPYSDLPKKIRVALIKYVIFWLNNTLKENQSLTPREMILGEQILDCKNICKIPFGSYVQVHEDRQVTNTMESRTTGAICLGPSNMNGGYNFFSLETGEIRRNYLFRWTLFLDSEKCRMMEIAT